MRHDELLDVIIQVVGCHFLDAAQRSVPFHIVVGTDAAIYLEENLQDWYQGCKRKDVQYRRQDIEQNREPQILLVGRDESS